MEPVDEEPKRPFGCATDSSEGPKSSDFRTVMFSGPHGSIAPVGDYGKVLMIATGFSIAAQLPFLKGLIQGFNRSEVRTRNLYLLWQLQDLGDEKPEIDLLDRALREDTLEHGYYVGKHRRVAYHNGEIDLRGALHDQGEPQSIMDRKSVLVTGRYGILQLAQIADACSSLRRRTSPRRAEGPGEGPS
ncbi:MAG: hypothetical protein Q9217_006444 [Psora testacea]